MMDGEIEMQEKLAQDGTNCFCFNELEGEKEIGRVCWKCENVSRGLRNQALGLTLRRGGETSRLSR
jgi:hypothetical protein